jgi:hypothetical protein
MTISVAATNIVLLLLIVVWTITSGRITEIPYSPTVAKYHYREG